MDNSTEGLHCTVLNADLAYFGSLRQLIPAIEVHDLRKNSFQTFGLVDKVRVQLITWILECITITLWGLSIWSVPEIVFKIMKMLKPTAQFYRYAFLERYEVICCKCEFIN